MNPFKEAHGPVFAAFTSLSIAEYNGENAGTTINHTCVFIAPPVEEELLYMHEFSKRGDKIKVTILADPEVVDTIKTVSELYTLEEDMYKYRTIKFTAWLDHISMCKSWYYIACSKSGCYQGLYYQVSGNQYILSHGVQPFNPCYCVNIFLEDMNCQKMATIKGQQATELFGCECRELVDEVDLSNKDTLPDVISDIVGHQYVFTLLPKFDGQVDLYVKAMERTSYAEELSMANNDMSLLAGETSSSRRPLFSPSPEKRQARPSHFKDKVD